MGGAISAFVRAMAEDKGPHVYALALTDNKWYIGRSVDVAQRVLAHARGDGAAWTKRYPPLRVDMSRPSTGATDEDALVKQYMLQYGIENVRGGAYSAVVLTPMQLTCLEAEMRGARDVCFKCGKFGHFASRCSGSSKAARAQCTRCGRGNHTAEQCYARTTTSGTWLRKL